ncbi:TRAP dicarboxylate transporter, DctQ subunit [Roseovarius sp. EC-HK134]|jgi:TRAP-type C4-dicarboxylate transport system permease small subunit|uniref:TRAP transporter small permease n=1 Tax=unclassified Roseovarius TaxID=2614913 RepID=UPI0001557416|nr:MULTISPECIES: TRAP transporter small permease subunit [unclassified Roseovarius]AWZ19295.1 TRAP-type transport system, small permease component, predicted N-acetylneuraminate transporter [Roseovarius sp. AK1035]EDM33473.1 TRAP dicarboxylate transporter, DctQ subunit [Roseovarius sp. TM1035]VVT03653.1 TRAP dicarboxylate transporter, DctQ subunit [Roseovarius sp. EC-HK134]VVT04049.1 TRAP dicarboxylate transporter, DctQ subunit [Roseovarius sp. EC-SD190]
MTGWFQGTGDIMSALMAGDSWMLSQAMNEPAAWPLGLAAMLALALLILVFYRFSPWSERNLEKTIMVVSYLAIGGIIFVEVFRRFVLSQQVPWSTTLPPFLFLIMTYFGCSYNVKLRTHLAFAEFRNAMSRTGQMACLMLDALLWTGFSWVVVVTSTKVAINSAANFQIMLGTDNVMQWWFLLSVPLAFTTLVARVIENVLTDIANFRSGETLITQAVIGGD